MKHQQKQWVIGFILIFSILFIGCKKQDTGTTGNSGGGSSNLSNEKEVSFDFTFLSTIRSLSTGGSEEEKFTADQVLRGEMKVTNLDEGGDPVLYTWTVYFDDNNWDVESNKTLILSPANYTFELTLTQGERKYVGNAALEVLDGENTVSMTIQPVIGPTITDINDLDRLAIITFQYDPTELAGITSPKLGVIVDSQSEEILILNPGTGLSETQVSIVEGNHTIRLKLYDGVLQVGRSIPSQETRDITLGQDNTMDLVPLHGETAFSLTEDGGDAIFTFLIPSDVVDEVGGLTNLQANFEIVGEKNPLRSQILTVDPSGDAYASQLIMTDYQYDMVSYTVTFIDTTNSEEVAKCSVDDVVLDKNDQTKNCDINVHRNSVITGDVLAVLGVNVLNVEGEPVAGAKVYANGVFLGLTNDGTFGTAGFFKHFLKPGDYLIRAEDTENFSEQNITLTPLEIENQELSLLHALSVTSWNFVDGSSTGLNKNFNKSARQPTTINWNNQLFVGWTEYNGTYQVRISSYDGISWTFKDGGNDYGINKNTFQRAENPWLVELNGQLCIVWRELYNDVWQIRAASFDGTSTWNFIDGDGLYGLNKDTSQSAGPPRIVYSNGKLFMTWHESNGIASQVRVASYDGTNWNFIDNGDNGINFNSTLRAENPHLTVWNNQIYVAWQEAGQPENIRVATYNGTTWSFIDGAGTNGINKYPFRAAVYPYLMPFEEKLYATWREQQNFGYQIRVAAFDGNGWSYIDGSGEEGINKNPNEVGQEPKLQVYRNQLYAIWHESNNNIFQIRVASYEGNSNWNFPGNNSFDGINFDTTENAYYSQLIPFNNRLYAVWHENGVSQHIRVAEGGH